MCQNSNQRLNTRSNHNKRARIRLFYLTIGKYVRSHYPVCRVGADVARRFLRDDGLSRNSSAFRNRIVPVWAWHRDVAVGCRTRSDLARLPLEADPGNTVPGLKAFSPLLMLLIIIGCSFRFRKKKEALSVRIGRGWTLRSKPPRRVPAAGRRRDRGDSASPLPKPHTGFHRRHREHVSFPYALCSSWNP